MRTYISLVAFVILLGMGAPAASAATQYWDVDNNISRAGAGGTSPTGTWSSFTSSWNSDSTGLGIPTLWTPGNTAVFAAGTNATGTYNVNVSGTISVEAIIVEEGFPTQNNGTLAFGTTTASIDVVTGAGFGQVSSSAVISGTGGVVKSGGGVLALRGTNSFSQSGSGNQPFLSIEEGTVDFQADANLGAAPSATNNAAALTINGATLRYSGSGALTLATNRGVTIGPNGGTIQVLNATTLALSASAPAAAALSGSATLTKTGNGRFRLQTAQTTFTGKYVVEGGSLVFPNEDRLGALPAATQANYFTLDGGGLFADLAATGTLNAKRGITLGAGGGFLSAAGTGFTYDGIISGTLGGSLSIAPSDAVGAAGTAPILLNSANTYNGGTLIGDGTTLSVGILTNGGINSGIGSSSSAATNLILDGGTLKYRGAATSTDRNFTITTTGSASIDASGAGNAPLVFTNTAPIGLNGTGAHVLTLRGTSTGDNILSQSITDSGIFPTTLSKTDTGTWVLNNTGSTYTGNTVISSGGRLKLGASGVIPNTSLVQLFSSATFDLNGFDETVRSVSGPSGTIDLGSKTLTINNPTHIPSDGPFAGQINGTTNGRIIKNGNGSLILSPTAATYGGGLILNAGILGVGSIDALGTGTFVINGAPKLVSTAPGPISFSNPVTLAGTLTIDNSLNPTSKPITWNTSGSNGWTITGGNGGINVNVNNFTINQPVGQDVAGRALWMTGTGTLTLNAANTYTGDTIVQIGTLSLGKPSLADWTGVFLNAGGKLNLNFPTDTPDHVSALFIDTWLMAEGTWGAVGSGAEHESALITGSGRLLVTPYIPPINNPPLAGDFNSDGKVDNGDYVTWRRTNGSNNALPNDNGLGTPVGLEHYNLWRQSFGKTTGSGSSGGGLGGGNIPEPTSIGLTFLALAVLLFPPRRRKLTA